MEPISLIDQKRRLEELIADEYALDPKGEMITEQYCLWQKQHYKLCGDIGSACKYIYGAEIVLVETEEEIKLLRQQVEQGLRGSVNSKSGAKARAYAEFLTDEIIPRLTRECEELKQSIRKYETRLAGWEWKDILPLFREKVAEEELTLF